ncbi:hypothetical protein ACFL6C_12315 [Myxococcota bacterium]
MRKLVQAGDFETEDRRWPVGAAVLTSIFSVMTETGKIKIGFWRGPEGSKDAGLPDPRDFVDPGWDPQEKRLVVQYLKEGGELHAYLGYSWCRFDTSHRGMGCRDLTDGTYVWPEGLVHYLEVHDVKPPREFITHVLQQLSRDPSSTPRLG